jgi:nitrogen-specific signal transduction histidine kinase/CheY-like chemotaxis protein
VLRPMSDSQGLVIAVVAEAVELTERKQAEEALRQSQKLEAMGQLTGGVAHDFNNLLTPIVGSLDLLRRRGLGGERENILIDSAMQSAERAKTLVQRLLAFARHQPLQSIAVDIKNLVTNMADLVASTTGPQIRVVVDVGQDLPAAHADPNQLEMAILNLSVNARDAMPDGGTLRISATSESIEPGHRSALRPGDYVRLSVADTGIGMDETTLRKAVEPFFSTKGVGKGTGLGLSMVHGLAGQLGGALLISSKRGLGTNVEFWLPVSDEPAGAGAEHPNLAQPSAVAGVALLVDDEAVVRMCTADMLTDLGFKVIEATSAEQAIELLNQGSHIDILITDYMMPGMNGIDLARKVRERLPQMPVLLVSGFAQADGVAPDLPRLTKPFRQEELRSSLANLSAVP